MHHGRLTVDLDALAQNYQQLNRLASDGAGAVVKANGYGLGAVPVAQRLLAEGCRRFFVATEQEGAQLRPELPQNAQIFVFSGEAEAPGLIPVANQPDQLRDGPFALHVDTGMQRLGFRPEELPAHPPPHLKLLISHLACADTPEHPLNARQQQRFDVVRARFPSVPASLANSAGILNGVSGVGRPGIGLYGGNPWAQRPNPMRCVATLEGQVLQVRAVRAGEAVGYGGAGSLARDGVVAIVGIGYADGVPRLLSGQGAIAFRGQRLPFVGRVSMDLTHVDATGTPLRKGDWVEFFGARVSVDEVARQAQTIAYEVLAGIGNRVVRRYAQGGILREGSA